MLYMSAACLFGNSVVMFAACPFDWVAEESVQVYAWSQALSV